MSDRPCRGALDLATWQPTAWRGGSGTLEIEPEGPRYAVQGLGTWSAGSSRPPTLVSDNVATQTGGTVEIGLAANGESNPSPWRAVPRVVPNAPFVVVPVRGLLERQFSIH